MGLHALQYVRNRLGAYLHRNIGQTHILTLRVKDRGHVETCLELLDDLVQEPDTLDARREFVERLVARNLVPADWLERVEYAAEQYITPPTPVAAAEYLAPQRDGIGPRIDFEALGDALVDPATILAMDSRIAREQSLFYGYLSLGTYADRFARELSESLDTWRFPRDGGVFEIMPELVRANRINAMWETTTVSNADIPDPTQRGSWWGRLRWNKSYKASKLRKAVMALRSQVPAFHFNAIIQFFSEVPIGQYRSIARMGGIPYHTSHRWYVFLSPTLVDGRALFPVRESSVRSPHLYWETNAHR